MTFDLKQDEIDIINDYGDPTNHEQFNVAFHENIEKTWGAKLKSVINKFDEIIGYPQRWNISDEVVARRTTAADFRCRVEIILNCDRILRAWNRWIFEGRDKNEKKVRLKIFTDEIIFHIRNLVIIASLQNDSISETDLNELIPRHRNKRTTAVPPAAPAGDVPAGEEPVLAAAPSRHHHHRHHDRSHRDKSRREKHERG